MTATHQRMIDTLKQRYGDVLYTHNNLTYPIKVYYPAADQTDVDSVLGSGYPHEYVNSESFPVFYKAHLYKRRRSRRNLTNGLSYVMETLTPASGDQPLEMSAKLGYYFDMMMTCDAFDHELRDYARGERDALPLRDQFHASIPPEVAFTSGQGRCPIIGGAALTVFNDDGQYKCIVVQRAGNMATGAGLYHTLPAFVFQPSGPEAFFDGEWSLKHQIIREFGEELFAMPEFSDWTNTLAHNYFYTHPPVSDLLSMLENGDAEIQLTGIAFNLLSLRPEVCAVLMIHDPNWYTRRERELNDAMDTERQETRYIPLDTLDGLPDDAHINMVPQGAAAMWLGIDRAREILKQRY